jgi:hypothetical protein
LPRSSAKLMKCQYLRRDHQFSWRRFSGVVIRSGRFQASPPAWQRYLEFCSGAATLQDRGVRHSFYSKKLMAWIDLLPKLLHLHFLHHQLPRGSHRILAHLASENKLEENANRARAMDFLCLLINFHTSDHIFSVAKIVPVISEAVRAPASLEPFLYDDEYRCIL